MESATLLLIIAVSVGFVVQPLLRNTPGMPQRKSGRRNQLAELQAQRDTLLAAIKDLEFDYEMGKLSEDDYSRMNARFRREAAAILQQIDQTNAHTGKRKKLEAELQALRRQKRTNGKLACAHCGAAVEPQHRFCGHCGQRLGA